MGELRTRVVEWRGKAWKTTETVANAMGEHFARSVDDDITGWNDPRRAVHMQAVCDTFRQSVADGRSVLVRYEHPDRRAETLEELAACFVQPVRHSHEHDQDEHEHGHSL